MPAQKMKRELWSAVKQIARVNGLEVEKFGSPHEAVITEIAEFLALPRPVPKVSHEHHVRTPGGWITKHIPMLRRFRTVTSEGVKPPEPVAPIIIYGEPGTGKTTFLYLIDMIMRAQLNLPDNLRPEMHNKNHGTFPIYKRLFNGTTVSLLSVRKWTELLNFYTWDTKQHQLIFADLSDFIQTVLLPMRVVFADEVEMEGYSPTIPMLAQHGVLVVGTSNQAEFGQLVEKGIFPKIYHFGGEDMRQGDPGDAVVTEATPAWQLFNTLSGRDAHRTVEQFSYRYLQQNGAVFMLFDFREAVKAPMLESQWINFLQKTYQQVTQQPLENEANYTLLFDGFSLGILKNDYDAIIRFIYLFDAIEQLGLGVLVRNKTALPLLSHETIKQMKLTIQTSNQATEEVKARVLAGIDRCASRIGQAGYRAQSQCIQMV